MLTLRWMWLLLQSGGGWSWNRRRWFPASQLSIKLLSRLLFTWRGKLGMIYTPWKIPISFFSPRLFSKRCCCWLLLTRRQTFLIATSNKTGQKWIQPPAAVGSPISPAPSQETIKRNLQPQRSVVSSTRIFFFSPPLIKPSQLIPTPVPRRCVDASRQVKHGEAARSQDPAPTGRGGSDRG